MVLNFIQSYIDSSRKLCQLLSDLGKLVHNLLVLYNRFVVHSLQLKLKFVICLMKVDPRLCKIWKW